MHSQGLAFAIAWIAVSACSSDDGSGTIDAGNDGTDAAVSLTFETEVKDLATGAAIVDVMVTDTGSQVTTNSAPNGRAVLMLGSVQATRVTHALGDYITNTMTVEREPLLSHSTANVPLVSELTTTAGLETLLIGLGITRDVAATQLLLYVSASNLAPATDVTVTVSGGAASYVRGPGGDFELGSSPLTDTLLFIPNLAGTTAEIAFSSSCPGPESVSLARGEIVSAFYVCDPSL